MSYYCPHCGTKLEFVIRPKFCPECGESTAPGAKKAVAATPARPSIATRRPVHGYRRQDQYGDEITEVPDIDGLSFSCDMEEGGRKFTIQDILSDRISTAGRRDTTGQPQRDVLADMQNEVKSSVGRLRSNESEE
jgi:hypothetical protein